MDEVDDYADSFVPGMSYAPPPSPQDPWPALRPIRRSHLAELQAIVDGWKREAGKRARDFNLTNPPLHVVKPLNRFCMHCGAPVLLTFMGKRHQTNIYLLEDEPGVKHRCPRRGSA